MAAQDIRRSAREAMASLRKLQADLGDLFDYLEEYGGGAEADPSVVRHKLNRLIDLDGGIESIEDAILGVQATFGSK